MAHAGLAASELSQSLVQARERQREAGKSID
jgi:hypothetical protein